MHRRIACLVSLLALAPANGRAQAVAPPTPGGVTLAWVYATPAENAQWQLLLVDTQAGATTQKVVPLTALPDAECRTLTTAEPPPDPHWCGEATCAPAGLYCARLICPPAGAYTAVLTQGDSLPSNAVSFGITAQDGQCSTTAYDAGLASPSVSPRTRDALPTGRTSGVPDTVVLSEDDVDTVVGEMTALDQEFSRLDTAYQQELDTIQADYKEAVDTATTSAQKGDHVKAQASWKRARERQTAVYERTKAHFDRMVTHWQKWLDKLQAYTPESRAAASSAEAPPSEPPAGAP